VNKQVHDARSFAGALSPTCYRTMIIRSCSIPTRATICSIRGPAISIKKRFVATTGPKMRVKMK
jgi:hypothetical protein